MRRIGLLALLLALLAPTFLLGAKDAKAQDCLYFEDTGHSICGKFLEAWWSNGLDLGDPGISFREALALHGLPMTDEYVNEDGLTEQVWERFVAELHPGESWEIQYKLLGVWLRDSLPADFLNAPVPDGACEGTIFPETGKCLEWDLLDFWERNGGLKVFGYALSNSTTLVTDEGAYWSQLTERQLLEVHPENKGTAYEIELARLGAIWLESQQTQPPATEPPTEPTPPAEPTPTPEPPTYLPGAEVSLFDADDCPPEEHPEGCSVDIGVNPDQIGLAFGWHIAWPTQGLDAGGNGCDLVVLLPGWYENLFSLDARWEIYTIQSGTQDAAVRKLALERADEQARHYGCPARSLEDIPIWDSPYT